MFVVFFFFQAEDGIRDLVRSRGLGDVYKRRNTANRRVVAFRPQAEWGSFYSGTRQEYQIDVDIRCLLYTSDAADERSSVDLGGRRIIKKKKQTRRGKQCAIDTDSEKY